MKFLLVKLFVLVEMVWAVQAGNCKANAICSDALGSCKKDTKTCDGTIDTTAGACKKSGCICCLPACPSRCTGTCPSGYTEVETQCLTFNTGSTLSWDDAQVACQKTGGRLAKPKDSDKLATYIKANHAGKIFWLGASDAHSEGEWLWLSGGTVDSSIWYSGEPNNAGFGGEDCMQWWGADITGYIDENCSDSNNYICEADKEGI